MLPKIINYCWFGKNPKSKLIKKCISSWKKFCPDFEIIEWNEENFELNSCAYAKEAYSEKKWAFVSDYVRFKVLFEHGGIYLDTDVELLRPIDELLDNSFVGFERNNVIAPGLIMGCESGDRICQAMIEEYEKENFIIDGQPNLKTVCDRFTEYMIQYGLKPDGTAQKVLGYNVYPTEYFNPTDLDTGKVNVTEKTFSIHHYAGTWVNKKEKFRGKIYRLLVRLFGKNFAEKVKKYVGKNN